MREGRIPGSQGPEAVPLDHSEVCPVVLQEVVGGGELTLGVGQYLSRKLHPRVSLRTSPPPPPPVVCPGPCYTHSLEQ